MVLWPQQPPRRDERWRPEDSWNDLLQVSAKIPGTDKLSAQDSRQAISLLLNNSATGDRQRQQSRPVHSRASEDQRQPSALATPKGRFFPFHNPDSHCRALQGIYRFPGFREEWSAAQRQRVSLGGDHIWEKGGGGVRSDVGRCGRGGKREPFVLVWLAPPAWPGTSLRPGSTAATKTDRHGRANTLARQPHTHAHTPPRIQT